jgi:hypothetical protein
MLSVMRTGTGSPATSSSTELEQQLTTDQVHELVALVCEARETAKQRLGQDFWYHVSTDEDVQSAMAIAWTRSFELEDLTHPLTAPEDGQALAWRSSDELPAHIPQFERGRFDYDRRLAGRPVSPSVVQALHTLQMMPDHDAGAHR